MKNIEAIIAGLGFVAGLAMAGAEGPIYINIIGTVVFTVSSIVISKDAQHA